MHQFLKDKLRILTVLTALISVAAYASGLHRYFELACHFRVQYFGDLNVTMWSSNYSKLIADSGLANSRKGFGILATWPMFFPLLSIPLDHCLVSPGIGINACRSGPDIGSDHLPLIVELAFE